ncbi:MAG: helix-turn-helix domain-containing protein [Deltaproteobacteria bacterium]|nr:MAG: helix-turn-helix domain-containing protein [Deltaproteobacteria bacterium]
MESLGKYLQEERLARGVTLEQISIDTRISVNMLRAIEDGDTEQLPAQVLVKGFLRAYAKAIGLDPEGVILKYQDLVGEVDLRPEAFEKFRQRLGPKPSKKKAVVILLTLILLMGAGLFLWQSTRTTRQVSPSRGQDAHGGTGKEQATTPNPPISKAEQEQSLGRVQQPQVTTGTWIEPSSDDTDPGTDVPAAEPSGRQITSSGEGRALLVPTSESRVMGLPTSTQTHLLRVEVMETTWLRITIDENREREYLFQAGDMATWQAISGFKLHIGNAAGLRLYLNGKLLKPLGKSGQVVYLKLPDGSVNSASASER